MRLLHLVFISFVVSSCSTIVKGTTQAVSVQTPGADGATCELTSPAIAATTVVTPASVVLEKSQHNVQVRCRKECFNEGTGVIPTETEVMAAGNVLVGGPIGLAIDAGSGAMNKYHPEVKVAMSPKPGCRSRA